MVDATMKILDDEILVPENLTDKILSNRPQIQQTRIRKINFAVYAQIAAVIIAGIFLGVVLGTNANSDMWMSKESKKQRYLAEYQTSHHLTVDRHNIFK